MREQAGSDRVWATQTAEKWPVVPVAPEERGGVVSHPESVSATPTTPLTPLSLDTILTAGDVKRILKIISSP